MQGTTRKTPWHPRFLPIFMGCPVSISRLVPMSCYYRILHHSLIRPGGRIPVQFELWEGMFHGWQVFARDIPEGREAISHIGAYALDVPEPVIDLRTSEKRSLMFFSLLREANKSSSYSTSHVQSYV